MMTAHSTLIARGPSFLVPVGSPIASSAIGPPPNRCNGVNRRLAGDALAQHAAARWGHERFRQQQQNPSMAAPPSKIGGTQENVIVSQVVPTTLTFKGGCGGKAVSISSAVVSVAFSAYKTTRS